MNKSRKKKVAEIADKFRSLSVDSMLDHAIEKLESGEMTIEEGEAILAKAFEQVRARVQKLDELTKEVNRIKPKAGKKR